MGNKLCRYDDAPVPLPSNMDRRKRVNTDFDDFDDESTDFSTSDDDDDTMTKGFGGQRAQHSKRTITKRIIMVAKDLPLKITRVQHPAEGTVSWDIKWDDTRNFLSNMRKIKDQSGVDVHYVGAPGLQVPPEEQDDFEMALEAYNCVPVFLSQHLNRAFLQDFCKHALWPVLHYVMPHHSQEWAKKLDEAWKAYNAANILYASAVARVVEENTDSIWVHNYHLFLLPSFIRNKRPRVKIGFFVHTPWCSSDVFRVMPFAENILRGILSADLVGFHTFDYVRHFLSSCKRVLQLDFETMGGGWVMVKYNGRTVSILISHVGVDAGFLQGMSRQEEVRAEAAAIREKYKGKRIICTIDTLDMVKASVLKFEMYERFLHSYPEWKDKIVLLATLIPDAADAHNEYVGERIQRQVSIIQERFGPQCIELTVTSQRMTLTRQIALYRASEILLVTTFWDGLNILPFEFTSVQDPADPGALIVSDFMGCSRSLSGVARVNPWDLNRTAEAVHNTLSLTLQERIGLHNLRIDYVMSHDATYWGTNFIKHLDEAARLVVDLTIVQVGFGSSARLVGLRSNFKHLNDHEAHNAYTRCPYRCIFVDYDGTLTAPTDRGFNGVSRTVLDCLANLCSDPCNVVFVMSGRRRKWLHDHFGHIKELGVAAEKGAFLRWPESLKKCRRNHKPESESEPWKKQWEYLSPVRGGVWKTDVLEVMREYTSHTDGSYIEDKELAIVWHYENADPEFGLLQARELEKFLQKVTDSNIFEVVLYDYSRIVEIKPRGVSKGATVKHIVASALRLKRTLHKEQVFMLAIGDDRSDESMFEAVNGTPENENEKAKAMKELRNARRTRKKKEEEPQNTNHFTCVVGMKPTKAQFYLQDHEEVLETLTVLAQTSVLGAGSNNLDTYDSASSSSQAGGGFRRQSSATSMLSGGQSMTMSAVPACSFDDL